MVQSLEKDSGNHEAEIMALNVGVLPAELFENAAAQHARPDPAVSCSSAYRLDGLDGAAELARALDSATNNTSGPPELN